MACYSNRQSDKGGGGGEKVRRVNQLTPTGVCKMHANVCMNNKGFSLQLRYAHTGELPD